MAIKTIPLSRLEADPRRTLNECADSGDAVSAIVAGSAAAVASDGSFSAVVPLVAGVNRIEVVATDGYGLTSHAAISVTLWPIGVMQPRPVMTARLIGRSPPSPAGL